MLNIEKIPLPLLDLVKFLLAQASKALMELETVRPLAGSLTKE